MEGNQAEVPIGLMQLDIMLPSQHFRAPRKQAPEQRLMIAVLQDAFECVERHRFATDAHRRRLFREAEQWFFANETSWPYSFECICGILDLDVDAVRQRLRVVPESQPLPVSREAVRHARVSGLLNGATLASRITGTARGK